MKKHYFIASVIFCLLFMIGMATTAVISYAQNTGATTNPWYNDNLSTNEIIATYHTNANESMNRYIRLMMKGLATNPDDPNGKPLASAAECQDPKNSRNYSTFCVAANLLGGNSDDCLNKAKLSPDYQKFCELPATAQALKGYLNYRAALEKKQNKIFQTAGEETLWRDYVTATANCASGPLAVGCTPEQTKIAESNADAVYLSQKGLSASASIDTINKEISASKEVLDQAIAAYDELRTAWPMHQSYIAVYKELETYRDNLVKVRQQTDQFPSKFIDLTTTMCK